MRATRALLSAALAALLGTAACGAPGKSNTSKDSGSGPIKIAVIDAQSGQLSSLGAWESKGAKLAVSEWNAKGGINGRKIKLDVFDDQGDPTTGTNLARKAVCSPLPKDPLLVIIAMLLMPLVSTMYLASVSS